MIKARSQKGHLSLNIMSALNKNEGTLNSPDISLQDEILQVSTKSAPIAQMDSEEDFTNRELDLESELLFDVNTVAGALKVFFSFHTIFFPQF